MEPATGQIAYTGPDIVTPSTILTEHALVVDSGRIDALVPVRELPADVDVQHLPGAYLAPGFIDLHVHGAAGRSYNEGTGEAIGQIGAALLSAGVTTALPTLVSAPVDHLIAALEAVRAEAVRDTGLPIGPQIPGVHLEGPYFSPAQAGAQDPHALRTPDDGTAADLLAYSDVIRMMSFAPELPGAVALTEQLRAAGIVAAAGHSDGTASDLKACQEAGLTHVIHVFSGQSTTRREGPWRVPGMLEATLASDGLTVEMIGDGKHLPALLMQLAHRALGDRLCLVSDATPGAGLPQGATYRMGQLAYRVGEGVGLSEDGTSFGGSTTLLPAMVPIVRSALGLSVPEAVAMATSIPAAAARLEGIGRLEPGFWADLVVLDHTLTPRAAAVRGHWHTPQPGKEHL